MGLESPKWFKMSGGLGRDAGLAFPVLALKMCRQRMDCGRGRRDPRLSGL